MFPFFFFLWKLCSQLSASGLYPQPLESSSQADITFIVIIPYLHLELSIDFVRFTFFNQMFKHLSSVRAWQCDVPTKVSVELDEFKTLQLRNKGTCLRAAPSCSVCRSHCCVDHLSPN